MGGADPSIEQRQSVTIISPRAIETPQNGVILIDGQIQQLLIQYQLDSMVISEPSQKQLEITQSQARLDVVGAIKTIEAIGAKHPTLPAQKLPRRHLVAIKHHA